MLRQLMFIMNDKKRFLSTGKGLKSSLLNEGPKVIYAQKSLNPIKHLLKTKTK